MVQTYKRQTEMYVNGERKEKAIPAVLNGMTLRIAANLFYCIQKKERKKERKKTQRRRETSYQSTLLI
jgi:hypothetical protein